jgi:hypothetical protein
MVDPASAGFQGSGQITVGDNSVGEKILAFFILNPILCLGTLDVRTDKFSWAFFHHSC